MRRRLLWLMLMSAGLAGCGGTTVDAALSGRPTHGQFATGQASGNYAVAQAAGTVVSPSDVEFAINATPAQHTSATWTEVCNESGGGAGSKSGQSTVQAPTVLTLPRPPGSYKCLVSVNSQLSGSGRVVVSLFNGGAPVYASATGGQTSTATSTLSAGTTPATSAPTASSAPVTPQTLLCDDGDESLYRVVSTGATCYTAMRIMDDATTHYPAADANPVVEGWACIVPQTSQTAPTRCSKDGATITLSTASSPSTVGISQPEVQPGQPSGTTSCGQVGLWVGPGTSCPFAADVYSAYDDALPADASSVPSRVTASGPPTHQSHEMTCAERADTVVTCAAGSTVSVSFKQPAACGSSMAAAYRCATAAAPVCQMGTCEYPAEPSHICAPGYTYQEPAGGYGQGDCSKPSTD
jgi:hypothetical protein